MNVSRETYYITKSEYNIMFHVKHFITISCVNSV